MLDLALYAVAGFFIALFGTSVGLALGVLRLPIILMIGLPAGVAAGTNTVSYTHLTLPTSDLV